MAHLVPGGAGKLPRYSGGGGGGGGAGEEREEGEEGGTGAWVRG
jgi:hypothetical protein